MKELGHLQVYDLILRTRTPLFVGSGKKYVKKEYLFDPKSKRASFLKEDAFFQLLTDRNLEERYEQFMRGEQDNLYAFLTRDCQLRPEEVRSVIRYSVDASDATVVKDKKREIHGFIRNAAGQVYLPGSSVKGAIRTALLLEKMQEELPEKDEDQRKRVLASRKREKEIPEGRYLNLLELRTRDGKVLDDAVNSIMRGLQISDSLPVPDSQMMLSKKVDVNQDGDCLLYTSLTGDLALLAAGAGGNGPPGRRARGLGAVAGAGASVGAGFGWTAGAAAPESGDGSGAPGQTPFHCRA